MALRALGTAIVVLAWGYVGLVLWTRRPYLLDLASHFAVHLVALELVIVIGLLACRRWWLGGLMLAASVTLSAAALSNYNLPRGSEGGAESRTIRVLHYNANERATWEDRSFESWLREQDPDLIAIVEAPWGFLNRHQWLIDRYPYRVAPRPGWEWAIVLLSKHPAQVQELAPYSEDVKFSFLTRTSLLVTVDGAEPFVFTALHPASPRRKRTWTKSFRQVDRDGGVIRRWVEGGGAPLIVCSDTNSTPMGRLHRRLERESGLLGWDTVLGGGTWPAALPRWLSIPIDRIWTSPEIEVARLEVGPRFGSDHRPVVAEIVLPAAASGLGIERQRSDERNVGLRSSAAHSAPGLRRACARAGRRMG